MKQAALAEPEAFLQDVVEGKFDERNQRGGVLSATVGRLQREVMAGFAPKSRTDSKAQGQATAGAEQEESVSADAEATGVKKEPQAEAVNEDSDEDEDEPSPPPSKFGAMPAPQNIVRMPAINWAKYNVVGESLDSLHEEQRRYPTLGTPARDGHPSSPPNPNVRAPEHHIAKPYDPMTDKPERPAPKRPGNPRRLVCGDTRDNIDALDDETTLKLDARVRQRLVVERGLFGKEAHANHEPGDMFGTEAAAKAEKQALTSKKRRVLEGRRNRQKAKAKSQAKADTRVGR
ncbi:hypothetical protein LTS18_001687 [Coniosporium uncinatum]|uniref:Uncharacterized protein n=1 Tax=Coniosporium uncinatum TaxID=93489 RepID=A0ACC3D8B8_9PEZI|nr:hypothetical protein LTS18_001687 [Coniosporium uncinatum]